VVQNGLYLAERPNEKEERPPYTDLSLTLRAFLKHSRKPPVWYHTIAWGRLIAGAHEVRKEAISYRNFKVGCGVAATKNGRQYAFFAANRKPLKEWGKICAEGLAIDAALEAGCDSINGLVVIGAPQIDHGSGMLSSVLHPCEKCRPMFLKLPQISPDTFFLGISARNEVKPLEDDYPLGLPLAAKELWRLGSLLAAHERAQMGRYELIH